MADSPAICDGTGRGHGRQHSGSGTEILRLNISIVAPQGRCAVHSGTHLCHGVRDGVTSVGGGEDSGGSLVAGLGAGRVAQRPFLHAQRRPLEGDAGARGRLCAVPGGPGRRPAAHPERTRHRSAVRPPGGSLPARAGRRQRGAGHAQCLGKDPRVQPADPDALPARRRGDRALSVPDQGAVSGPAGRAGRSGAGRRPAGTGLHLRRRHAGIHAGLGPRTGPHRHHQSGHAAHGRAAASPQVGPVLPRTALRGDRRAAHLPRRVRLPPGQRHSPPEADRGVLRSEPALRLLLGDHRQPAGAGPPHHRGGRGPDRPQRRARGGAQLPALQPTAARRSAGHPAKRRQRGSRDRHPPAAPPREDHRVRAFPHAHGADLRVCHGVAGRPLRRHRLLSRRLPPERAAPYRTRAARRVDPRRGVDQRAGAGHRHRRAGRVGDGRVPRHHRLLLAAGGPIGPHDRRVVVDPDRLPGADRSVRHPPSRVSVRHLPGVGPHRSGQHPHPAGPAQVRGFRAAVSRRRRGDAARGRSAPVPGGAGRDPPCRGRMVLVGPRLSGRAGVPAHLHAPERRHRRRHPRRTPRERSEPHPQGERSEPHPQG